MAYATSAEFNARYTTKLDDTELSSHYLPYASTRLDEALAPYFSVPFSGNNLTARDLTIDMAYLMILQRSKEPQDSQALRNQLGQNIEALAQGSRAMMTTSGEVLYAQLPSGYVWSNTEQGSPAFELDAERIGDPLGHCT